MLATSRGSGIGSHWVHAAGNKLIMRAFLPCRTSISGRMPLGKLGGGESLETSMTSFKKSLVAACALSVLGLGTAFAQTDPNATPAPAAAAPASGDMSAMPAKPMMKKMHKKHMSKKMMMKKKMM